jgi:hypothetical protein
MTEHSEQPDAPEEGEPHLDEDEQVGGEHEQASDTLASDVRALETILRKTGRAYRRPMLVEGLLWFLATVGAVALSALLVGVLIEAAAGAITSWMFIVGTAAATLGAVAALVGFRARRGDAEWVATLLQRHQPSFRNDLVAALEFGHQLLEERDEPAEFSHEMARAHVKRTARRAHEHSENGHLAHLLPERALVAPAMSLAGCAVLIVIPALIDLDWTVETLVSPLSSLEISSQQDAEVRPILGELSIYYSHPPYTDLGRKMDPFSTGYIEALEGTEVVIESYPISEEFGQVELVMETDEGTNAKVMEQVGQGRRPRLRTSFVAMEDGRYQFRATLPDGTVVEDGNWRKIDLTPDEEPKVNLTSHSGEVEVSPDDVLEIEFEASDDFGLTEMRQVWYFAGDSDNASRKRIDLPELSNKPKEAGGGITFDLTPLSLQTKDVVIVRIEATDNNTLTGPGQASSKPLTLRVSSPEDKHLQNIVDQQELLEELLGLLADYLETPMGERQALADDSWRQRVAGQDQSPSLASRFRRLEAIQGDQERILEEMNELVSRLKDDPLMVERDLTLFSALHEQLSEMHRDGQRLFGRISPRLGDGDDTLTLASAQRVADYSAGAEETLETGILRFEDLLASQKMEAIQATAKDIEELKDRLKELLERYKETQDPELKKAIRRDIQRLRQRMAELMQRMQMQLQKLPEEHMNMDAINQQRLESDTRQMSDSLEQIEQMLENDDIDGALEALENMETSLDSLTQDMDEQFGEAQPKGLSELDKKVGELMDDVNDLQQAEQQLESETAELNEELAEKRREEIDQMLDQFTDKMQRKVERQKAALEQMKERGMEEVHREGIEHAEQRLEALEEMLGDKDIEQSLERAREALQANRRLRFRLDLSRRYADDDDQRDQLDRLGRMNQGMERRGQQIVDDLEDMMDQAQQRLGQMDHQRMQELAERQKQIGEQAEQLDERIGEASKRFPMLEQQLKPAMKESREKMGEAAEGLEGRRTQRALDSERAALEQLGKLKEQMKQAVRKERQQQREGSQGTRRDEVEIPGEGGEAGPSLREDVVDKMKDEKLENYESEIERYYRSIME